ncbi:MAG: elongation factor G [Planctomycetales bacterium]
MPTPLESIRNIGIIAHIDAGKTTTTERILYYSGAQHRMGDVDTGDTATDVDPEEAQRGITIYSAAVTCRWAGKTINIIDTPGHVDFTAEVERSLRVLDGGIVIFSAMEGVEAQSETVWRQADRYNVPRICFINKMDRIGASFERTFDDVRDRLAGQPVAIQVPMGAGSPPNPDALTGVIDLIEMKAITWDAESLGAKFEFSEIPEQHRAAAEEWRGKLMETVAMLDDELMAAYLENQPIDPQRIHDLLRKATIGGQLQPTLCGTSLNYIGVQPLLDAVVRYLPSPLDRPPVEGDHPNPKKGRQVRKPSPDEPFAGLIFKIQADKHADLCFVRVYSGKLKSGSRVLNARTGKKELVSQLWHIQSDRRDKIEADEVLAGDIVGVIGPKEVVTGDTLCDPQQPVLLENIRFPETVISMAVEPDSSAERKKLEETLVRLAKQDPTFHAKVNEETGQTIISGMGELHLEIIKKRMERDFGLKVKVHKPRVSYRETVRHPEEAVGEFHRQAAGAAQFARLRLRVEPNPVDESIVVENKMKPGTLPADLARLAEQEVRERAQSGGRIGYPLMKARFTLLDADYREGETTDFAVQAAASAAVNAALDAAGIVLLEPVMRLEVVTPDESLGAIQGDLNMRRAMIVNSQRRGDLTVLEARVPLSAMFGYSTQVRSLSQGRASYSMEPLEYAEAPREVLDAMLG